MNRRRQTLFTSCLLFLSAFAGVGRADPPSDIPPAVTIPATLTLEDALRLFHEHGLDLILADANVESARADVRVAAAVQNPTVNGSVSKSFTYDPSSCDGPGCSDIGWGVGLSDQALWDVVTGKRGLRIKTARAALAAAHLGRKDAERTLSFQVKQQFVQVALGQRALDFAVEVEQAAGQTADLNKRRYQAGAISEVDLSKVETDYLEAQQALDTARATLRQQQVGLAFLLGARAPVPEFKVQFDLAQRQDPLVSGAEGKPLLIDQAMSRRPDLKAQAAQRDRAEAGLEAAYRQRVPDGVLSLNYVQQGTGNNAITPPTLTFGLQLTLPLFNQNQGGVQKSRADVYQQAAQYAKVQSQVVSDVETSYTGLDLNRRLITRLETGLLERAKLTRDLQKLRYQKGAASLLDYLDAQRVYITSNQEYFQALANYWTARFQLEQAVGM